MGVFGKGQRKILVVSDHPGPEEDEKGRALVGGTGRFFEAEMNRAGIDMTRDCWLTNATICYSKSVGSHKTAVDDCRPNLLNTLRDLNPEMVLLMGGSAIKSMISYHWGAEAGAAGRWAGTKIPLHKPNVWVLPTYNPARIIREIKDKQGGGFTRDDHRGINTPILTSFRQTLNALSRAKGRPWKDEPPDYAKQVEVLYDEDEASERLFHYSDGIISFDLETTTLKPDSKKSEIVCASVCWNGKEAIAFPWHGKVKGAMVHLLTNPNVSKIGFNAKFEDRWIRKHLGVDVIGWAWDGMLAAHAMNPTKGTTGLAYQSFVRLGQAYYSQHIDPYLESAEKGGYSVNRARDIKLSLLLKYCGLDSLLEYKIAMLQADEMGVEL